MWWEHLMLGLVGGVCVEVWQAAARGLFHGRDSWKDYPAAEVFAGVIRLLAAAWAGLLVGLPLVDPPPLAPILGGALAPLLLQDVVRRTTAGHAPGETPPSDKNDSPNAGPRGGAA